MKALPAVMSHPGVRRWGRRAAIAMIAVLALAGAVAVVAPPFVRGALQNELGAMLDRPVTVGAVHINLLRLSAGIDDLKIGGRAGEPPLLEIGRAEANLEGASSLLHRAVVVRSLRVERPQVYIAREAANRYSISDILERLAKQPKKEGGGDTRFALYNIEVTEGLLRFNDKSVGREHRIERLAFALPFISSIPADVEVFANPRLSALVNGTAVELGGKTRPFSRERRDAELQLKLAPVELAPYLAYLPKKPGVSLEKGKLAADLHLRFEQLLGKAPSISLSGQASLLDWLVRDSDGSDIAHFDALRIALADVQPLARKAHVQAVELVKPEVAVEFDRSNRIKAVLAIQRELLAYTGPAEEVTPAKPDAGAGWQWQLDRIALEHGHVGISNVTTDPPVKMAVETLDIELKGLSSALDKPAGLKLAAKGDAGESIGLEAKLTIKPLHLAGVLDFAELQPARGASYVAGTIPGLIVDGARLTGRVPLDLQVGEQGVGVVLTDAELGAADMALRLRGEKTPFLKVPKLALSGLTLDLPQRTIKLGAASIDAPEFALQRDKDGRFNLARLTGNKPAAKAGEAPKATQANKADTDWHYALGELTLNGATLRYDDVSRPTPLRLNLSPLTLAVSDVESSPGSYAQFKLTTGWNQKGRLSVNGRVSPQPLRTDLKIDGSGLDVVPLLAQVTRDYEVSVTRAKVSAQGALSLDLSKPDAPAGSYKGRVAVADFSSLDLINDADFVRWGNFSFSGIDLRLSPLSIGVGEIALRDLQTRLILSKEGELNLREVTQRRHADDDTPASATPEAKKPAAAASTATVPPAKPMPPIRIDRIVLSGASINYSDRFVRPNFDARLSGVAGRIENLGTDPAKVAALDLRGAVDGLAPLEISGQLAPFRNDRFLDVKTSVKGYELTALSAYASKYVGYGIEKGKLSMDLRYRIEDRKLSAENHVFLDQLTFGDKVESPDATSLPVRFAVNLLKNSRGEIDVNLPVGGTLDDPEFSVGGIVWKMILNFFGKIVSSPFSFLAGGDGGADVSQLAFTAGLARIDADGAKRLELIAKTLKDRPSLTLDLTGRADPLVDAEGLKRESYQRKVRSLKLQDMAKVGESGGGIDEVRIDPAEYPALLKRVYADEKIPNKPRNVVGMQKDVPVADMERMLMSVANVGDADVRALAQERANQVKTWLVETGKVPVERVFVLAPKLGEDKDKSDAKAATSASRVDFSLR
ncbi:DUF748 domain-containing protein [Niveibacterium sp.]|uniref:DUF748 domain-containing protein n=1 Tax=Niveibacterium sp. TaxID=2017444 RepID=UPI0035B4F469